MIKNEFLSKGESTAPGIKTFEEGGGGVLFPQAPVGPTKLQGTCFTPSYVKHFSTKQSLVLF